MIQELSKILDQDSRFPIKLKGDLSTLTVSTIQARKLSDTAFIPDWSVLGSDHHQIHNTLSGEFMVTSYFKPLDEEFVFESGMFQSTFNRVAKGKVTSGRPLSIEEICTYIIQLEAVDRAIIEHFERSRDIITLDEIAEALTVDYILRWRPLN